MDICQDFGRHSTLIHTLGSHGAVDLAVAGASTSDGAAALCWPCFLAIYDASTVHVLLPPSQPQRHVHFHVQQKDPWTDRWSAHTLGFVIVMAIFVGAAYYVAIRAHPRPGRWDHRGRNSPFLVRVQALGGVPHARHLRVELLHQVSEQVRGWQNPDTDSLLWLGVDASY